MAEHGASIASADPPASDRVHNAIVDKISGACFPVVEYLERFHRCTTSETVAARTILAREISSNFADSRNRICGGPLQERDDWSWVAIVHFDRLVSLEAFEEEWMLSPIVIYRDSSTGLNRQIDITLVDAEYMHPPGKQPSGGTRVTFRLQVKLSPR